MILVSIDATYFNAGIEYDPTTRKVVNAAPILGWSLGKSIDRVYDWCHKKGFTYQELGK